MAKQKEMTLKKAFALLTKGGEAFEQREEEVVKVLTAAKIWVVEVLKLAANQTDPKASRPRFAAYSAALSILDTMLNLLVSEPDQGVYLIKKHRLPALFEYAITPLDKAGYDTLLAWSDAVGPVKYDA